MGTIDQGKKDIQSTHWRTQDIVAEHIVNSLEHLKRLERQKQERIAERQRQRTAPIRDKLDTYRAKEDQTMAMFRQMAEEQKKRGGL